MRKLPAVLASAAIAVASLVVAPAAHATDISGSGSSYAGKMFAECIAGYTTDAVTYNPAGSGTGKKDFADGKTAFGASDSLYEKGTEPKFDFTYVPAVAGPIAIAYNAPELKDVRLTPALISDIFLGKIKKWNDKKIAAVNKGVKLPNQNINVVYRKDGSGTTNNFSNWLKQTVPNGGWVQNDSWATATGNKAVGIAGDKSQGVRAEIKKTPYSIGYLDLADALAEKFGLASVQNGAGKFVKPTVATARNFLAAQKMDSNGVVTFNYNAKSGLTGSKKTTNYYSVVLVAYAMAPTEAATPQAKAARNFIKYVVNTCVPQKGANLGYVAFSGSFLTVANRTIDRIR